MGIFSKIFKGHQPEEYHIDPDKYENLDSSADKGTESKNVNKYEADDLGGDTIVEKFEDKSERKSFSELIEMGAKRAEEARQRRAETRARWADNAKSFWARAKSGIGSAVSKGKTALEVGKAAYYAKGDITAEAGERVKDYAAGKIDQAKDYVGTKKDMVVQKLESGYAKLSERADNAKVAFNNKVDQAGNWISTQYDAIKENRRSAKEASLIKQRAAAFELWWKLNREIEKVAQEKADAAPGELSEQTA